MLKNYLLVAFRNLWRNKTFSAINIIGLSLGLTCSLLILLWVRDQRSIDTFHANTARRAIEAGAEIVNDVSGHLWDPDMSATCAELGCGTILMHPRGRPQEAPFSSTR